MAKPGIVQWIGQRLVEWLTERVTEPVFQQRSLEETRALIRLLTMAMMADGEDSTAEQQLLEFLMTNLPKSWRQEGGQPMWRALVDQGVSLTCASDRLDAALEAAAMLQDPRLRERAYEMVEMIFQASPTPPEVYNRWHHQLAEALQIPQDEQEARAAAAASEYHFRLKKDVSTIFSDES